MSGCPRFAAVLAFGVVLGLAAARGPVRAADDAAPLEPPLTNEDIVRLVASGAPDRETIETIRSRTEAFDLSNEMIEELKLAGVSEAIVSAMRQRHAELAPAAVAAARPTRGRVPVVVALGGSRTLKAPAWADEDAKARFQLPKENDQRQVKDLAVFFACVTSEHVPDLWRSKTPLGRDMNSVVRHEMLAFAVGDTPAGKPPRITLPAKLEADVEDGVPHDFVLGIAARIGDRWIQLAFKRLSKVTIEAGSKPLTGRIDHRGHGFDFTVELSGPR